MQSGIAHGGRLIEARRAFPQAPEPFIDLSTGINPHPYPLGPLEAESLTRLPEPEALGELQEIAAGAYGARDPAMVVAAPGTQILISLLPHLLGLERATILGPTYAEHEAAWAQVGAAVGTEHEPAAFLRAARVGGAAILCNPNNPDGSRRDPGMVLELADAMRRVGGVVICDEAFADLETPDPGLARYLPHPGLLILRSFGKTYGLAGLRLGFLLASPELARHIRLALGPWAVSGPALSVGCTALADPAWRDCMGSHLQQACERLDRLVTSAGLREAGGTRLFRLFRGGQASAVFHALGAAGILTRRFAHDPDLLRFGLPGCESHWDRLRAVLAG
jgi:cobalamin biosynthetic protein CobC